jgi:hypothetical protein
MCDIIGKGQWMGLFLHQLSLLLPGIRSPWHRQAIEARSSAIAAAISNNNNGTDAAINKLRERWSMGDSLLAVDAQIHQYCQPLRDLQITDRDLQHGIGSLKIWQLATLCKNQLKLRQDWTQTVTNINDLCRKHGIADPPYSLFSLCCHSFLYNFIVYLSLGIPTAHAHLTTTVRRATTSLVFEDWHSSDDENDDDQTHVSSNEGRHAQHNL